MKERRYGRPRTDVERAMSHYGITEAEYLANPDRYPLPERGTGFTRGTAAGTSGVNWGAIAILGLLAYIAFIKK